MSIVLSFDVLCVGLSHVCDLTVVCVVFTQGEVSKVGMVAELETRRVTHLHTNHYQVIICACELV